MKKFDLFFNESCTQYVIEVISQLEIPTCMFKQMCFNPGNQITSDFNDNSFVEEIILYKPTLVKKLSHLLRGVNGRIQAILTIFGHNWCVHENPY